MADARIDERLLKQGKRKEVELLKMERKSRREGLGFAVGTLASTFMIGAKDFDPDEISIRKGREQGVISDEEVAAFGLQTHLDQMRLVGKQVEAIDRMSKDRIPHSEAGGAKADR